MAAKVTLKDIAREVGLSPAAVSLVLNDRPCRISAENRRRIKEVARKMRYVPNQIARSLVTQHSQTVGLIVPNIESRFFSSLARRLELGCRERGYALIITNSDDSPTNDSELVRLLANRGTEGLLVVASDEADADERLITALSELPVPYVMVDRLFGGLSCDKVSFNNEQGGYLACRHLLEAGHRRIACIVNRASNTGRERLAGYERALVERGVDPDPALELESAYYIADAYAAAGDLLDTNATAVFASSDNIALGLLKRLYVQGMRVPRDCSVVSYDNSAADVLFEPALTSIEQNVDELAGATLELLFRRLKADAAACEPIEAEARILMPRLVVKDSVRAL
ncbi:LacI family DNA-binding transcriptional regulator [Thermophilibacter immobilis]|uniref:LacI family DNA-binding transcriptional regulator n=1 Tax=Thermophilibacter immobilis TaxID=2779519 RepID=A0A7S7RV16_9ACTN|nr:LacI family DNA-binding transcriptional regulator [Thermophilibacter immobilis]QOY60859.1 LacI family DNA-binding transcriptional regulator [Thermophilibacter immobilis]